MIIQRISSHENMMSKAFMSYQFYVERNKECPETYGVLMVINV